MTSADQRAKLRKNVERGEPILEGQRKRMTPLLAVMAVLLVGCQSMTYQVSSVQKTALGTPEAPSRRHVERKMKAHYMFWGLLPVSRPDIAELALSETQQNEVLSNISIKEQNTFVDGLLAAITYGLYRPRTVQVSGDVFPKEVVSNAR
jgi:predicted peptidase